LRGSVFGHQYGTAAAGKKIRSAGFKAIGWNLPLKPAVGERVFRRGLVVGSRFPGLRMTVFYLEALATITLSLSILMAIAWSVQRTSAFFPLPPKGAISGGE
jgi:hypothetical protein